MKNILSIITCCLMLGLGTVSADMTTTSYSIEKTDQGEKGGKKGKKSCKHSKVSCAKASAAPSCHGKAANQGCAKACPKTKGGSSKHSTKVEK